MPSVDHEMFIDSVDPSDPVVRDALYAALDAVDTRFGALCFDYATSRLSAADLRKLDEELRAHTPNYLHGFARRYYSQGMVEGLVEALLAFLEARGIPVSQDALAYLACCTDLDRLEEWIKRAATVGAVEDLMRTRPYNYQSKYARSFYHEGKVHGMAKALRAFLKARCLATPGEVRARIKHCSDLDQLENWVRRAAIIDSVEELFD